MNVLVVGGAGYIGSITAAELVRAGHHVIVLDTLRTGHRAAVPVEAVFVPGDLGDRALLDTLFREHQPQAVMHFAAASLVPESMVHPAFYFRNNVAATLTLLETMLAHAVKKFVFSSTAAVYGFPETVPIPEDAPTRPINPYGESKLMVERMLRWFDEIHSLRSAVLRYFNAAGATPARGEDHTPETHLIPLVLQVALGQREAITIFGTDYPTPDGTAIRDYIHVVDLAQAHILALAALDSGSRTYNLGNSQGFSVREVIEVTREVTGHPIPAVEAGRRPGDPAVLIARSARIQRELGWTPRFPTLREIIGSAWAWHQAHPEGFGDRPDSSAGSPVLRSVGPPGGTP
ncbi:MAG: UDP-glucose 4-epimerase GalE [Ardenticatenaceae bacterium]|nr:UDP-glucose 4-epimerase GalE [Ardenticatenaceae bacterium]